ncbi:MAG: hypothetical protein WDN25_17295 [Acetobacteraceae bacterium]
MRPVAVAGEDLAGHFGTQVFDVAHIRNAIDHAVHPMAVVEQMLAITRPGGFLIIHGFENEAIAEHWHGFHQWNMRVGPRRPGIRGAPRIRNTASWRASRNSCG